MYVLLYCEYRGLVNHIGLVCIRIAKAQTVDVGASGCFTGWQCVYAHIRSCM